MKKEDLTGLIVYVVMLAIAVVFGFTILKEYSPSSGLGTLFVLFVILAIVGGVVLAALLEELGHITGAKIGGYNIDSVSILGFTFVKIDGKFKFKFASFDGLTGETKISPKKNENKEPNPTPYLLFPGLYLFIEILLFIVLFIVFGTIAGNKASFLARTGYFLLTMAIISAMVLVYNIFPVQVDTTNDGYRFKLISNPKNKEAFNELLRVERAIENGETGVEVKTFETITNFTAELNLNKVYTLFDQEKFTEAEPFIDTILANKEEISPKLYVRTKAQKIYIYIMTKTREEALEYYNREVPHEERKAISQDISMSCVRAYLLMSGLLDGSESETIIALNHVLKAYKRTNKNRQSIEMRLYNNALNKVIEAHPKWGLEGYFLQEKE